MSRTERIIFIQCILYFSKVSAYVSEFGAYDYVEYQPGDFNLILAAPNDGNKSPGDILDRRAGCYDYTENRCVYGYEKCSEPNEEKCAIEITRESFTRNITVYLADELEKLTGYRPYVVLNHLHRRKLDPDNEREVATQGSWFAKEAYSEYHSSIKYARRRIKGPGLFLDINGHSHSEAMVELGYDIKRDALNSGSYTAKDSSIKSLGLRICGEANSCFKNIINGAQSLGQYIQNTGYYSVPSNFNRRPGPIPYNSGGYSIQQHGSKYWDEIDAVQLSIPSHIRNQREGLAFARSLARAVQQFMERYYW